MPCAPVTGRKADTQIVSRHVEVLQILPALDTGGAEKMVLHLTGELMRTGTKTGVISFFDSNGSQIDRELRAAGIPVWSLGKRRGPDLAMIARLKKLIAALRPDVIHTHLSALRYAVPAVARTRNPPGILHTIHRFAERDSEFGLRWLQRWCLRRSDAVIAVSEGVAKSCARVYDLSQVPVIPNGIPFSNFGWAAPDIRAAVRRSLGIDADSFVFCCVARLRAVKNHKTLLKAFAGLNRQTGAHLLLAGDGELRGELEALAGALRITDQVHFLGEQDNVAALLTASDAFVLSSLSEGTPLSVLEAMMAGLPIVATSVGGLPELVRNGTEGLLAPPADVKALRDAMAVIISDIDARQAMSQAAREKATTRYGVAAMARSYLSAYGRLDTSAHGVA
jgi:glycosyltransferase involved in cell wall biosynthesis